MSKFSVFDLKESANLTSTYLILTETRRRLTELFGQDLPFEPNVFLLYTRRDIDLLFGSKTPSWLVGFTKFNSIYALHSKAYITESSHAGADLNFFFKIIRHELFHLYFFMFVAKSAPRWFAEGAACYFSDQPKPPSPKTELLKIFAAEATRINPYEVGYNWIKLLTDNFGDDKVIQLIKSQNNKKYRRSDFNAIFKNIFGHEFTAEGIGQLLK